jgi:hypothetical protein
MVWLKTYFKLFLKKKLSNLPIVLDLIFGEFLIIYYYLIQFIIYRVINEKNTFTELSDIISTITWFTVYLD